MEVEELLQEIEQLKKLAEKEMNEIENLEALEKWRIKYLGRKSKTSQFFFT